LGIKQGGLRSGKWAELPVTNSPKVVHFAIGHEGLHAILRAEDGTVFFAGTARRGEDGDQSEYDQGHFVLYLQLHVLNANLKVEVCQNIYSVIPKQNKVGFGKNRPLVCFGITGKKHKRLFSIPSFSLIVLPFSCFSSIDFCHIFFLSLSLPPLPHLIVITLRTKLFYG
jgi:hypothetical protein